MTVIHATNSEKVPVTTSAKEGAVFESILPQQKQGNDDVTSLEFGEGTSANESAVLETISPQQKRKTTVIHAKNSEKVPVTTSAKQGAVFESILPQQKKRRRRLYTLRIRRRYERKRKCSFRDHFTLAKKEDDGYTR